MTPDVRLLAIAGPSVLERGDLVAACLDAQAGGVTGLQLRFKSQHAGTVLEQARALVHHLSIPVWINDRADIALAAQSAGVHVGWEDVPPAAIRAFADRRLQIGMSVGTVDEARRALAEDVDYWSIGPMYATQTKSDAGQPIGPHGFSELAAMAPPGMPVIAIGGITRANIDAVMTAGAHGIAVSHAVFGAEDVRAAARALRDVIDRHLPRN
jgi:thiamine-phosphate pyrophosphorylase